MEAVVFGDEFEGGFGVGGIGVDAEKVMTGGYIQKAAIGREGYAATTN